VVSTEEGEIQMKDTIVLGLYVLATILALLSAIIYPLTGMKIIFSIATVLYAWMSYAYYSKYKKGKKEK